MFEAISPAPPDPILGLTEAFRADPSPEKINLGVGVYQDEAGQTPLLESVRAAEQRLAEAGAGKGYLPITGDPDYGHRVRGLLFGADHELACAGDGRAATAQAVGGTGALRIAASYLAAHHPEATLWVGAPTWANHHQIFEGAGLAVQSWPWLNAGGREVDEAGLLGRLEQLPAGDVVLLHGCCHNPTGADLSPPAWAQVAEVLARRRVLPLIDLAYQGFGTGLEADAAGLRTLAARVPEMLVASSFSKNFSLYNERAGALTVVAETAGQAGAVMSHVKRVIRRTWSNPPAHGAAIVRTVLADTALRASWEAALAAMRHRIQRMRRLLAERLAARGARRDYTFMTRQQGMFSFSGLGREEVGRLQAEHAIYMVASGRINVAGINEANVDRLAEAIVAVEEGG